LILEFDYSSQVLCQKAIPFLFNFIKAAPAAKYYWLSMDLIFHTFISLKKLQ